MKDHHHKSAPLYEAVQKYVADEVVPFHVPGHKQGRGLPELTAQAGKYILKMDVNGMKDLDFIGNPSGVIKEAQQLCALAFGAQNAYFLVNGTTSGVQAMIMSACEPGSEIIIPRNAHKSTFGGIILSGAIPVYVKPECDHHRGIATGVAVATMERTIQTHAHAKAVLVINPNYYGIATDLKAVTDLAHQHHMAVLADEAHGAHMYFHPGFPTTAMEAGADMSAASMHKTAGALTQASLLLLKSAIISEERVKQNLDLTYTSSASYLLMSSLDLARKQMALHGHSLLEETKHLAQWTRQQINAIPGLAAFGHDLMGTPGCYDFDETKLGIQVSGLGYTGYQVETLLRSRYQIQVEMADLHNILAVITIGDRMRHVKRLVEALREIASQSNRKPVKQYIEIPSAPEMIVSPRDAFYSPKKSMSFNASAGELAGEMIMAYPPGIPVICPGERITRHLIDYVRFLKEEGCALQGTADPEVNHIRVLGNP